MERLTDSQLSRPEMRSVELARSLFKAGAARIDLEFQRRSLRVSAPGAELDDRLLDALARSADPKRPSEERYAALLDLESQGGLIWLALATGPGLVLSVQGLGGHVELDVRKHRLERSQSEASAAAHARVLLRRGGKPREERELLEHHLRHARRPVRIDGEDIRLAPPTAGHPLVRAVSGEGFLGHVCVRSDADYSCIRWIRHEVLDAERYSQLAGGVAHEASIYCGSDPKSRDRAVVEVRDARETTVASLHQRFGDEDPSCREEVRRVMFARAIERHDLGVLGSARVFDTLGGDHLSVADLVARASRGPVEVTSMDRDRRASDGAVFLDAQGRRLVTELLNLPIAPSAGIVSRKWPRRIADGTREWFRDLGDQLRQGVGVVKRGRAVPPAELNEVERRFCAELQQLLQQGQYRVPRLEPAVSRRVRVEVVPRGRFPLQVAARRAPKLQLPRSCPTFRRILAAYGQDRTALYPALDLMFAGRDGWGSRRLQWRQKFLQR